MVLDVDSSSLSPLPEVLSRGLIAVSTLGLLSFICSSSLFLFLTWRLISWRSKAGSSQPNNQFLLLIYNLLLADLQQAMAFLLNFDAIRHDAIRVGTTTCWAQGWFVSTGDLASSVFISAIALHTFLGVVKGYRPPTILFWSGIAACWTFVYVLGAIGPLMHGEEFYVRAGAWCWVNHKFSAERLWLHYFWIFLSMFSSILIYTFIIVFLRRNNQSHSRSRSPSSDSHFHPQKSTSLIHGATPLMILYPLIYTICTAPLALGRIYSLAGNRVSLGYFCVAGSMIASNGWLDVLLYASTRRDIVFSEYPPGEETGLETFAFYGRGHRLGTVTTIQAGGRDRHERRNSSRLGIGRKGLGMMSGGGSSGRGSSDSVENLTYKLGDIEVKGTVSVKVEDKQHGLLRVDRDRSMNSASPNVSIRGRTAEDESGNETNEEGGSSWDQKSVKSTRSQKSLGKSFRLGCRS